MRVDPHDHPETAGTLSSPPEEALDPLATGALQKLSACVPGVVCSYRLRTDGTSCMPFATQQIEELYGLPRAVLAGDMSPLMANLHPEDAGTVSEAIATSARELSPWHDIFRYLHPKKGLRWIEGWAEPEAEPDGSVLWHGFVMDVTDRTLAEQRVERLSRLYRTLSDINEAIALAESEAALCQKVCDVIVGFGGIVMARILFYQPERNVLAQVAFAGTVRTPPDLVEVSLDPGAPRPAALVGEVFASGELRVRNDARADGTPEWRERAQQIGMASIIGLPLRRDGQVAGVLAVASDETGYFDEEIVRLIQGLVGNVSLGLERLAWARELRASEERYRSLIENMDHVVYTVDAQGRFTYVSAAASNFGFTPQELLGKTFWHLLHENDGRQVQRSWSDIQAGARTNNDVRVLDGKGKIRQVCATSRPLLEGGRFVGLQGVVTDLTRQRETEEQLRQAQKLEAIGRLAGGVAHDFNNLLMVISSYTELVLDAVKAEDPLFADLEEIRKAAARATGLTRQLLAFSRKQVLQPRIVDLNELVGGLEKMLRRLLGEDIHLIFAPAASLGAIRADAGQLEQVLMNLALNARDAMPNGGQLTIRTQDVEIGDDRGEARDGLRPGRWVMVSVTDTGTGMDEATLARIFEPFFTTKPVGKGTGLGLATAYGIVKQSCGAIQVSSEVGKGSTFDILLPREATGLPEAQISTPPRLRQAAAATILVVEDEEAVRRLTERLLAAEGYKVLTAANGGEALLICEKRGADVDLLLTDVVMPGIHGRELAERLVPLCPRMKVLFMSGYSDDVIMERGALAPGTHLISKPFNAEALLRKVQRMLES